MKKIKAGDTITIIAKEWFDSVNANTYFRAHVLVNGESVAKLPFQYGYGEHYAYEALKHLDALEMIKYERHKTGASPAPWYWCEKNSVTLKTYKYVVRTEKSCKTDYFQEHFN